MTQKSFFIYENVYTPPLNAGFGNRFFKYKCASVTCIFTSINTYTLQIHFFTYRKKWIVTRIVEKYLFFKLHQKFWLYHKILHRTQKWGSLLRGWLRNTFCLAFLKALECGCFFRQSGKRQKIECLPHLYNDWENVITFPSTHPSIRKILQSWWSKCTRTYYH